MQESRVEIKFQSIYTGYMYSITSKLKLDEKQATGSKPEMETTTALSILTRLWMKIRHHTPWVLHKIGKFFILWNGAFWPRTVYSLAFFNKLTIRVQLFTWSTIHKTLLLTLLRLVYRLASYIKVKSYQESSVSTNFRLRVKLVWTKQWWPVI